MSARPPFKIIALLPDPANPQPGECKNDTGCGFTPCVCRPCDNCRGPGPLDDDDLCEKCRPEPEPEEDRVCARCNGSGEGSYDGSRCTECGGTGSGEEHARREALRQAREEARAEMLEDDKNWNL